MTTITPPVCFSCLHFQGERKCDAFPDEIPDEIWFGDNDHTQPVEGDHEIRFEQIPGAPEPIREARNGLDDP